MSSFSEWTKKKKKAQSFTEYTKEVLGTDDIEVPIGQTSQKQTTNDIAPVKETKKTGLFKGSSVMDDGFQWYDAVLAPLATVADVGAGLVQGVGSLAEGVVDLGMYGVAKGAELFGADSFADNLKEDAQKNYVYDFVEGVRENQGIKGASLLGDSGYDVASGVGQIAGIILTGGAGAAAGLGTAGVTALTTATMGASSMGSGMSEAYQDDATDEEAFSYGAMKGVIDAGTELIFGGLGKMIHATGISKGLSSADDILARKLSEKLASKITSKGVKMFTQNAVELGVKSSAEGLEEFLAGAFTAAAKDLTYKNGEDEESIWKLLEDENLLEQFAVGALTSGIAQSGGFVSSVKNETDFVTGLTANEQKVVDKVVEDRIAEAEEGGKKLTNKEKNKIYDEVMEDLERGDISADTIEEMFGGDTYKAYRDILDKEKPLLDEMDRIKDNDTLTDEQKETLTAPIREKLNALAEETNKAEISKQLDEIMKGTLYRQTGKRTVTDGHLIESFNERTRRGQRFEADLSKYDEKQKAVVQKAIDSGILNNSRRTHEFVDMLAKLSADKGVLFDFTNNEKLKESGFAVDKGYIHGYYDRKTKTIGLNIKSRRALNTTVGHEITHVLEGTELYGELQKAAFEYAKTKKDYDGRRKALESLYDAKDIDSELTADLVGEYLFDDTDFIKSLSVNNRNVFQKIYDEIKYLCKIATAGSKEKRQLETVKRAFEKAYREATGANKVTNSGTNFSLSVDNEQNSWYNIGEQNGGNEYARTDEFRELQAASQRMSDEEWNFYLRGGENEVVRRRVSTVLQRQMDACRRSGGFNNGVLKLSGKGNHFNVYEGVNGKLFHDVFEVSRKYLKNGELVDLHTVETTKDGIGYDDCYNYLSEDGLSGFSITPDGDLISVFNASGKTGFLRAISDVVKANAKTLDCYASPNQNLMEMYSKVFGFKTASVMDYNMKHDHDNIAANHGMPKVAFMVNTENDVELKSFTKDEYDEAVTYRNGFIDQATPNKVASFMPQNTDTTAEGEASVQYSLTAEQQEYFKDSKVRDENGNLKVMYHGTPNGDFTVFKDGTYFTENKEYADLYQNPGASSISTGKVVTNPKTFEVYLDIKKPFDISDPEARSVYINDYIKGGNAVGINPYLSEAEYNKIDTIDWTEGEDLREFLIDNGYDYDGLVLDEGAVGGYGEDVKYRGKSYVVFSPEQVKNKDNQNPTSNPDIRYSLTEYTAEEKKAHNDAVLKHFGKTYKWAETGYLLLDGTRLDLSGKHDGAPGGYRTVDHRDITEALGYDYGGGDYSGSLIQFMSEGNIRIIPESNGINLSVKPTKAQEQALSDFISRYRGEVMLDIDDSNGYTVVSVEYPYGTYYTRVLNDIREWFDNGKKPEVSGAYPFRSLSAANEQQKRSRNGIYGEDIRFDAPIKATEATETAPKEVAPVSTPITESEADEIRDESFAILDDTDAPIEREPFMADYERQAVTINNDSLKQITDKVSNILSLDKNDTARLSEAIQKYAENPDMTGVDLVNELRQDFKYTEEIENYDDRLEDAKRHMKGTHIYVPENLKGDFDGKSKDGFNAFRKEHFGHFYLTTNESAKAIGIDQAYQELRELFPEHFPEDIWNPADQLQRMGEVASSTSSTFESMDYDDATFQEVSEIINSGINQYSQDEALRIAEEARNDYFNASDDFAPVKDKAYEAIRPKKSQEPSMKRANKNGISTVEKTSEAVSREVFNDRSKEVYFKIKDLSSGKYHQVGDYGFHLARSSANERATITIKTPDGKKLQRVINGGNFWKNSRLWSEAAKMVAENDYPNVKPITSAEEIQSKVAKIVTNDQEQTKKKPSALMKARTALVDEFSVFEDLALKTKNRKLDAKANAIRSAEQKAQYFIGHGAEGVRAIKDLLTEVEKSGLYDKFQEYMYDLHNTDRMSLEEKARPVIERLQGKFQDLRMEQIRAIAAKEITEKTTEKTANTIREAKEYLDAIESKNKAVRGFDYTADVSRANTAKLEAQYPQFKKWAQDVYDNNNYLREQLVKDGVISREMADLWAEIYPHYVPIRRLDKSGVGVSVPLDTNKTGVNAPIKRATGGDSDIGDLFKTMAMRAEQTFKAGAKNSFGVELMNTLGTRIEQQQAKTDIDETIDGIEKHEELLKKGENGANPTFTVFENGKRVEFEITEEMYDALKPTNELFTGTNKVLNKASEFHRKLLTELNPIFTATNAIKDAQDVLVNSQHPIQTYKNIPKAISELWGKSGQYYTEFMKNGAEQEVFFDSEKKTFVEEDAAAKKVFGFVPRKITEANNFIERVPRLAEYIASREAGRSIEVSMLDADRVTTNFKAGGDVTKWANRNGVTFLNASVQGAAQQVRNIREAKANGLKGWVQLATKFAVAGLPAMLLNNLLWEDDEEYEELSDYVKDNYYVVAKYGDGQFVRIPKGRTLAVIQDAFEQVGNLITGNDEVDLANFLELAISNLAPNNPLDNNVFAPIIQAHTNTTWYGEDLVPTRLQDLPNDEQYDESTDAISKWLGEHTGLSPYRLNYLLNQYSGAIGDVLLPMLTPEAERGDNSLLGNAIAPIKDKFTTDSVMNNQNVSDFYSKVDELTTNAKSFRATDEDILKYKYMNSINAELGELYGEKREIQNIPNGKLSDEAKRNVIEEIKNSTLSAETKNSVIKEIQSGKLSAEAKYNAVKEIQKQIDSLAKDSLNTYGSVNIDNGYATIGNLHFRTNKDGEWEKITDKQLEKQEEVTSGLGISPSEYWSDKEEYDFEYENPEKYDFLNSNGVSYDDFKNGSKEFRDAYNWAFKNPEKFTLSKAVASDVVTYRKYASELSDIEADKDENGKSISGSCKEKVADYINNLDIDYGAKIILFKNEYNADDRYNREIIDYLNSREDISFEEMRTILIELGFRVDSKGHITWD